MALLAASDILCCCLSSRALRFTGAVSVRDEHYTSTLGRGSALNADNEIFRPCAGKPDVRPRRPNSLIMQRKIIKGATDRVSMTPECSIYVVSTSPRSRCLDGSQICLLVTVHLDDADGGCRHASALYVMYKPVSYTHLRAHET